MSGLSPDERTKLARICGLLSSSHDGERATAALMATTFLRDRGVTWFDALEPAAARLEAPAPAPAPAHYGTAPSCGTQIVSARLLRTPDVLSTWEQDFLRQMLSQRRLTPKQRAKVWEIADRVKARGAP